MPKNNPFDTSLWESKKKEKTNSPFDSSNWSTPAPEQAKALPIQNTNNVSPEQANEMFSLPAEPAAPSYDSNASSLGDVAQAIPKRLYAGALNFATDINKNIIGPATDLLTSAATYPIPGTNQALSGYKMLHSPEGEKVKEYLKKKTITEPGQTVKALRKETPATGLPTELAYGTAEGIGGLIPSLATFDVPVGSAISKGVEALGPKTSELLSNVPEFAYGMATRAAAKQVKEEPTFKGGVKAIAKAGENLALGTIYNKIGEGSAFTSIPKFGLVGAGETAVNSIQNKGKLPTKKELEKGFANGSSMALAFVILPTMRRLIAIPAEKGIIDKITPDLNNAIKNNDNKSFAKATDKIFKNKFIRPEFKKKFADAINLAIKTTDPEASRTMATDMAKAYKSGEITEADLNHYKDLFHYNPILTTAIDNILAGDPTWQGTETLQIPGPPEPTKADSKFAKDLVKNVTKDYQAGTIGDKEVKSIRDNIPEDHPLAGKIKAKLDKMVETNKKSHGPIDLIKTQGQETKATTEPETALQPPAPIQEPTVDNGVQNDLKRENGLASLQRGQEEAPGGAIPPEVPSTETPGTMRMVQEPPINQTEQTNKNKTVDNFDESKWSAPEETATTPEQPAEYKPGQNVSWEQKNGKTYSGELIEPRKEGSKIWEIKRSDGKTVFFHQKSLHVLQNQPEQAQNKTVTQPPATIKPIAYTSKASRDNPQRTVLKGDQITLINKNGRKQIGKVQIPLAKWEELDKSFGNPNWNKREYVKTLGIIKTDNTPEMHAVKERILDGQVNAIDKVYSQYKAASSTKSSDEIKKYQGPERRVDQAKRQLVAEMTPEELRKEILTDTLTGLPNRRAYEEAEKQPSISSIDVDSLKWVNDNLGHQAGDSLLKVVGKALGDNGVVPKSSVFHISGDEFTIHAKNKDDLISAAKKANNYLKKNPINGTLKNGTEVTFKGGFSYGIGSTTAEAEGKLQQAKNDRQLQGKRSARGERPPGVVEQPAKGGGTLHKREGSSGKEVKPKQFNREDWTPEKAMAEWDRTSPKKSEEKTTIKKPSAKEKISEAEQHMKDAFDGIKELNNLFGERGSFSTEKVDEALYAKAKKILQKILDDVIAAGKSLEDFVRIVKENLTEKGRSYFKRFVEEDMILPKEGGQNDNIVDLGRGRGNAEAGKNAPTTNNEGRLGAQKVGPEGNKTVPERRGGTLAGPGGNGSAEGISGNLEKHPAPNVPKTKENGNPQAGSVRRDVSETGGNRQVHGSGNGVERSEVSGVKGLVNQRSGRTGRNRIEDENYHISDPSFLLGGTPKQRFAKNKAAIETYNLIKDEMRNPTEAEKNILAAYSGWGSFGQELFQGSVDRPIVKKGWEKESKWLQDNIGKDTWKAAQASILNAHYTDPPTVTTVWNAVKQLGFKNGRVLEPSVGIGNFFGLMPKELEKNSSLTGIELDYTTAGIAKMLYPKANIQQMGYQDSKTGDDFYDLVIGNWPFAAQSPADRRYNPYKLTLHDYFFVKALDQVRPGGFVAGITAKGTMDKKGMVARIQMSKRANLVAAFRMPTGAFKKYAGTNVVADLLIFQKRKEGMPLDDSTGAWKKSVPMLDKNGQEMKTSDGKSVYVNEYWAKHPENVLGKMTIGHGTTQYGEGMIVNRPNNYEERLSSVPEKLPKDIMTPRVEIDHITYISNNTKERQNSITKSKDGGLYVVRGERLAKLSDVAKYAVKNKKVTASRISQIKQLVAIRKAYGKLIDAERTGKKVEALRKNLNSLYTSFVKKHGQINKSYGIKTFKTVEDPLYPALTALEINTGTKKSPIYEPAKILTQSTQRMKPEMKNPSISDAFILGRNKNALQVDLDWIAKKAHTTVEAAKKELVKSKAIYETPGGAFEVADIYLAGNVKQKIVEAKAAQEAEPGRDLSPSIKALEKVVPEDIPYYNIGVGVGATWIPAHIYQDFIGEIANLPKDVSATIKLTPAKTGWIVKFDDPANLNNRQDVQTLFSKTAGGARFTQLISSAFSGSPIRLYSLNEDNKPVFNPETSKLANEKVDEIRTNFQDWIWKDTMRRVDMEREYNDVINAFATPKYDGSFLNFDGMALEIGDNKFNLRKHQIDAIWRGLATGRGLYAHEVGTGKTFTMAGIAVESRRYGLAKKPLLLAHNANSADIAADINTMYPGAKVLYLGKLKTSEIKSKLYQIANDDWDAIVMPHSLLKKLTLSKETLNELAEEEISSLEAAAIDSAEAEGIDISDKLDDPEELKKVRGAYTAKELVKQRNKIIETIRQQAIISSKPGAIPFEDLGIDMILIDEAHIFKKSPLATKMQVKGLNTQASKAGIGLNFLTSYIKKTNAGRGVFTFTGTPVTNTLNEIYNQMKYVMSDKMKDAGIDSWDAWFNTFAEVESDIEMTSATKYKSISRLTGFQNVSDLRRFAGQYMDIVFADDLPEFAPRETKSGKNMHDKTLTAEEKDELENGRIDEGDPQGRPYKKVVNDVAPMSPEQKIILDDIIQRAESFENASGKERREIQLTGDRRMPLIVQNDADKAAFDAQAYDKNLPEDPNSKINRCVRRVLTHYVDHPKIVQVLFMEKGYSGRTSHSHKDAEGNTFKTYSEAFHPVNNIIQKLVEGGIPKEEIAVVDGKVSKEKRKAIAEAANQAKIRVLIGQTETLGTGINMQENLKIEHDLDAPWMPGQMTQRLGRAWRQGNRWNTIIQYKYITEKLDGKRWQTLAKKEKVITDFLKAKEGTRSISGDALDLNEDNTLEDITSSFSQAAGDPRILIRAKLQKDVDKLLRRERIHDIGISDAKKTVARLEGGIGRKEKEISNIKSDSDHYLAEKDKPFSITLEGKEYTDKKKANAALEKLNINLKTSLPKGEDKTIGTFRGFKIIAEKASFGYNLIDNGLQRKTFFSVNPSIASMNAHLRNLAKRTQDKETALADTRSSIKKLKSASKEVFGQAKLLKTKRDLLTQIKTDLKDFPTPPPPWLIQGSPTGTDIYMDNKPYTVEGHRQGEHDYYILIGTPEGTPKAISYKEAMDENNMPIYADAGEPKFQTAPTGTVQHPGNGIAPADLKALFKGQRTRINKDGDLSVRMNNGLGLVVKSVNISAKDYQFALLSGKMSKQGAILGKYQDGIISLDKNLANRGTAIHEIGHFLVANKMLTKPELILLNKFAHRLKAQGKFKYEIKKDPEENQMNGLAQLIDDRAKYRDKTGLNKIIQKAMDFVDGLTHLGRLSERKLAREFENGRIFNRQPVTSKSSGPNFQIEPDKEGMQAWAEKYIADTLNAANQETATKEDKAKAEKLKEEQQYMKESWNKHVEDSAKNVLSYYHKISKKGWQSERPDTTFLERLFQSPEFYYEKVPAAQRVLEARMAKPENFRQVLSDITEKDKLISDISLLKKNNKEEYNKISNLITDADQNKKTLYPNDLKKMGFSDQGITAWSAYRKVMNNGFDKLYKEMDDLIKSYEEKGLALPSVVTWEAGKPVTINLKTALAMMGDMRGYYAPRMRKPGKWMIIAKKEGEHPILEFRDTKIALNLLHAKLAKKGYSVTKSRSKNIPEDVFSLAGQTIALNSMINKAFEHMEGPKEPATLETYGLEDKFVETKAGLDYQITGPYTKNMSSAFKAMGGKWYGSDQTWHFVNPDKNIKKRLMTALTNIMGGIGPYESEPLFAYSLATQVANIIKGRGFRSSMIKRSDETGKEVWEGYEKDPLAAAAQYAAGISGGLAKRQMAYEMVKAVTGTDIDPNEYDSKEAYTDAIKERRIDPASQKNIFHDVKTYMEETLRNQEFSDRVINLVKSLAVLKYLAFRVSSSAVNLTALATSVPAALNEYAGIPLAATPKYLADALSKLSTYRFGDRTTLSPEINRMFDYFEEKGWNDAQFKQEALAVLQSRVGKASKSVLEWGMYAFGVTEQINRMTTLAAAYMGARKNNIPEDEAFNIAKKTSDRAHGIYMGDATLPHYAQGQNIFAKIVKSFYVFSKFSHTYLQTMYDIGWKRKNAKALLYMMFAGGVVAGAGSIVGWNILMAIMSKVLGVDDPEQAMYDFLSNKFGPWASYLSQYGLVGLLGKGVSLKGSLQINVIGSVPTTIPELLGAPGSIYTDLKTATEDIGRGQIGRAAERALPNAMASPIKAIREYRHGVTTKTGAPKYLNGKRMEPTALDTFYRSISFNPAHLAAMKEKKWSQTKIKMKYQKLRSDFYVKLRAFFAKPPENRSELDYKNILLDKKEYNDKVKAGELNKIGVSFITPKSIKGALRLKR